MNGKKVIHIAILLTAYLVIIRPLRTNLLLIQREPIMLALEDNPKQVLDNYHSTSVTFRYYWIGRERKVLYKIPFGRYFLLTTVFLIVFGFPRLYYVYLFGFHGLILIVSYIILIYGLGGLLILLTTLNFITHYITPISSFGILILAQLEKQNIVSTSNSV